MKVQVLIAPGLGSSGPLHWQTLWENENPEFRRIEQLDWETPKCSDWIEKIEEEVENAGEKVIIIAHSLACIALVHWANKTNKNIKAALLVAPADAEGPSFPEEPTGFSPIPLNPLPFRSIVIASTNDPYITIERCTFLAEKWGSKLVNIGNKGHINTDSKIGNWEEGKKYLHELIDEIQIDQ